MTDFDSLIPEMRLWNDGKGIDVKSWISCVGSFEHLTGYLEMLWPRFLKHDGCLFFADGFRPENYLGFMKQTKGNKTAVEMVMNHVHLADLFGDPELKPTEDQLLHIGGRLQDVWSCKLARDFPTNSVTFRLSEGPFEYLEDIQLTFFQEDHGPV